MPETKQRIYINGRFLTQKITGVQRYATEMVLALDRLLDRRMINPARFEFTILVPRNQLNELEVKHINIIKTGSLTGHAWEQLELPWAAKNGFLLNLCNVAPLAKRNQAVTIHDMAVFAQPENYSAPFRFWYKFLYRNLVKSSSDIFTVSSFSKDQILHYTKINPDKLMVVLEGKEHMDRVKEDEGILRKNHLFDQPYILAVSSMNPNKNFKAIVESFRYLENPNFKIVIAGGANPKIFADADDEFPDFVLHLGYITDEELKALYKYAFCFIYPSFYEGFGLPPLEAMANACPVIVSNQASLPEVCGDAAIYCDPYSPEDIADKIQRLFHEEGLRNQLSQKAKKQAQSFSWEQSVYRIFTKIRSDVAADKVPEAEEKRKKQLM